MNQGILTGANREFWPTLRVHVTACLESHVDVAVADHGLDQSQRQWLEAQGATLLDGPFTYSCDLYSTAKHHAACVMSAIEAWWKPLVCLASPFDRTLWIDADAVPIRGIAEMFDLFEDGPWLTRESWVTPDQARRLYEPSVRDVLGHIPPHYSEVCGVNNGVFGFHRGDAWLREWRDLCERFLSDPKLLANCKCRDQTALITVLARDACNVPRIIDDRRVNWPANGLGFQDRLSRKRYDWGGDVLESLRADHHDALVVHWMGRPKPWEIPA